jgi:hypothetical protein
MGRAFFTTVIVGGLVLPSICLGYSGGYGTEEEPYKIANKLDLLELAGTTADYSKFFVLMADVNMEGQVFTAAIIAADTSPSDKFQGTTFTGTFDGNNHKITNFTINGGSGDYVGLFGYTGSNCEVRNLGIVNCDVSGNYYVGGLTGFNHISDIINCYSTGMVSGASNSRYVGGLAGNNYGGVISGCYSTGSVNGGIQYTGGLVGYNYGELFNCYSTSVVSGSECVGGLAGENYCYLYCGSIVNCYSAGTVSGENLVGGLAGENWANIENCYSTGTVVDGNSAGGLVGFNYGDIVTCYSNGAVSGGDSIGGLVGYNYSGVSDSYSRSSVSGTSEVGGLVGHNYTDGSINNCYSRGVVSGETDIGGLAGVNDDGSINGSYFLDTSGPDNGYGLLLTEEQMMQQVSFTDWDFEEIWGVCEGTNYPRLRWQIPRGDFVCPDGVAMNDLVVLGGEWLFMEIPADVWPEEGDGIVNFLDWAVFASQWEMVIDYQALAEFASQWLKTGARDCIADIAPEGGDRIVSMPDFAVFANNWLKGLDD